MSDDIQYGEVKRLLLKNGYRFGFLYPCDRDGNRIPDAKEIYFDLRAARTVETDPATGEVSFGDRVSFEGEQGDRVIHPRRGQLLAFYVGDDKGRPRASEWAWAEQWIAAEREMDSRPTVQLVRVNRINGVDFKVELWAGHDLYELSVLFPRIYTPAWNVDCLFEEDETDNPDFTQTYYFAELGSDGDWKTIDDPRIMWADIPDAAKEQLAP